MKRVDLALFIERWTAEKIARMLEDKGYRRAAALVRHYYLEAHDAD